MANATRRAMPDDFLDMHKAHKTVTALAKHYRANDKTIARWMDHHGISRAYKPAPMPIPEDFKMQAPIMPKAHLARLYGVSDKTIARWVQETGVYPPRGKQRGFRLPKLSTDIAIPRRETPEELAADYLRKFMAVSRCLPDGRWRKNGTHYRCGSVILDAAGLLGKADYYRRRHG